MVGFSIKALLSFLLLRDLFQSTEHESNTYDSFDESEGRINTQSTGFTFTSRSQSSIRLGELIWGEIQFC